MSDALPELRVGDHVTDRDGDDTRLLVVGRPADVADEYLVDGVRLSEYNPSYPDDDSVVEAIYPQREAISLDASKTYAFPRSRLRIAEPIHGGLTIEAAMGGADD